MRPEAVAVTLRLGDLAVELIQHIVRSPLTEGDLRIESQSPRKARVVTFGCERGAGRFHGCEGERYPLPRTLAPNARDVLVVLDIDLNDDRWPASPAGAEHILDGEGRVYLRVYALVTLLRTVNESHHLSERKRMSETATPTEVFHRLVKAIEERSQSDIIDECYAEDLVVEHPFMVPEPTSTKGREQLRKRM